MEQDVTHEMVTRQLEYFAKRVPLPAGEHWMLDYSEYGGYGIRISNPDSSESEPFGAARHDANQTFDMLRFAIVALDIASRP